MLGSVVHNYNYWTTLIGHLTYKTYPDGAQAPDPDGALKEVVRIKNRH
jgi:hypothetical protein